MLSYYDFTCDGDKWTCRESVDGCLGKIHSDFTNPRCGAYTEDKDLHKGSFRTFEPEESQIVLGGTSVKTNRQPAP